MKRSEVQDHVNAIIKQAANDSEFCFRALNVALCSYMEDEDREGFIKDMQARTLYKPEQNQ